MGLSAKSEKELRQRLARRFRQRPKTNAEKGHIAKRKTEQKEALDRLKQVAEKFLPPETKQAIFADGYIVAPSCPTVHFTNEEWANLAAVAKKEAPNTKLGYGGEKLTPQQVEENLFVHFVAKCAISKKYKLQWATHSQIVGGAQIHGTKEWRNRLIVHDADKDDLIHIQVSVDTYLQTAELRGWAYAKDAKKQEYRTDFGTGREAFGLPCERLRPTLILAVKYGRLCEGGDVG